MTTPFERERIDNWVGDFCATDVLREFATATREFAPEVLATFLLGCGEARGAALEDIEEADVRTALLGPVARLALPTAARQEAAALCGALLAALQEQGRLGGGRLLGAYCAALRPAFEEAATGKSKPIQRPGSKIGRNAPCPCGSGRKYKKCCGGNDSA